MTLEQLKADFPDITIYNRGKYVQNLFSGKECWLTAEGLSLYLYLQAVHLKYRFIIANKNPEETEFWHSKFIKARDAFKKAYPKEYTTLFKGVIHNEF